jgi:hypothetical protein
MYIFFIGPFIVIFVIIVRFFDFHWLSILVMFLGGVLVGFGTRYASGCTSGHAITGLSTLQLQSLLAVLGIFAGGLLAAHLVTPHLFSLFW